MKTNHKLITGFLCLLGSLSVSGKVLADNYVPQGPFVEPLPSPGIPHPTQVPGKEYSDYMDKDHLAMPDPEQTLLWDGVGGTADGYDYGGTGQVDAMANIQDSLYWEVIINNAALLFSTGQTGENTVNSGNTTWDDHVLVEPISGGVRIWATPSQIDRNGVVDVDGLEVWGPEQVPNANVFSLDTDPNGISLWFYNPNVSPSRIPLLTRSQILSAISPLFPGLTLTESQIDLDAVMVWGAIDGSSLNSVMFSLDPTGTVLDNPNQNIDGGEIFVWEFGTPSASFLNHGGHLWDTAFSVKTYIDKNIGGGIPNISEDVDALEAVATPEASSTLSLLTLGLLGAGATLKRKLKPSNSTEK